MELLIDSLNKGFTAINQQEVHVFFAFFLLQFFITIY